ncbi:MAG TPA: M48 family metalloprotease [Solirubrobacteraceae bacterium]|nr:M48 family metalloprotease [Solirubrobacteraceae bacterium]
MTADTPGALATPPLEPEIAVALEEYRTVRQEEITSMQSYVSTLRYGVTGCVVLIGVAAQQHGDRYLGWAIALALVPLVVLFSAVVWMGEYERMARAGHYVAMLEGRISSRCQSLSPPLHWESWLREGGITQSRIVGGLHRYITITGLLIAFQVASVVMGLHFYWHSHPKEKSNEWVIPVAVAINYIILVTLLGYFRSCYERLRDFTSEPEEHKSELSSRPRPAERKQKVRPRLRIRVSLYLLFGLVGLISTPWFFWPLSLWLRSWLNQVDGFPHVELIWIGLPAAIWMTVVPLLAPRGVMRELLYRRIVHDEKPTPEQSTQLAALKEAGLLSQLTEWDKDQLRVVESDALNAPAVGRHRHFAVTTDALAHEDTLPGTLAHELGHQRLQHIRPLVLSYLYMWPYLYYDDKSWGLGRGERSHGMAKLLRRPARLLFTAGSVSGWLAWVVLRLGWRTAEYDADRFACQSGNRDTLVQALERHKRPRDAKREESWQKRLQEGLASAWLRVEGPRSLGYLPIPNEHPSPERRLKRLDRWEQARYERPARDRRLHQSEAQGTAKGSVAS